VTRAALRDLIDGRWPKVIGFSWWNAAFYNDPADPTRESDMRIENSPGLPALFGRWWERSEGYQHGAVEPGEKPVGCWERAPQGRIQLERMQGIRALLVLLLACGMLRGYAVLSHEAIIDSAWRDSIQPLLLKRFPQATPDDLLHARAYAYGGSILQDMGYYPFGNKFFSDLVHYVRSGDFVAELIRESQDIDEYAFALGALAHYAADNTGHPLAVNTSVALQYPKLRRKYGPIVTYGDNPAAHLRVEFGFDVLESSGWPLRAHGVPRPHRFRGLPTAAGGLVRNVYGLDLNDHLRRPRCGDRHVPLAVRTFLPLATKVAWGTGQGPDPAGAAQHDARRFSTTSGDRDMSASGGGATAGRASCARFWRFCSASCQGGTAQRVFPEGANSRDPENVHGQLQMPRSTAIARCWRTPEPDGCTSRTSISTPGNRPRPPNTGWPTTRTRSWRALWRRSTLRRRRQHWRATCCPSSRTPPDRLHAA